MSSSVSFSSDNLVDTLPTTSIIIDGAVLNDLRPTSFLSMPRAPSPDKPLPIVPLFPPSLSSIDGSIRYSYSTLDSTLDSISLREQTDTLPPTPTLSAKNISTGLSTLTHAHLEPLIPLRSSSEKSSHLPRSPLRPSARSLVLQVPTEDAWHTTQHTPHPNLRIDTSTSFSTGNLVDSLPTTNIIIDGAFLNDKPRAPPYLSTPRTPSPDKPLPITPLSPSSPNSMDDNTLDGSSLRDPTDSPPPSVTLPAENISAALSKRTQALLELIESERVYASDLALLRDVHLPVALGNEPPIPTPASSSSSILTLSNASGSSVTLLGPPMSRDDARIIFSNVPELAEFADDFVNRLETALGNVLPSGEGEDRVGALFIEMIPCMERPYMHYITRHPASLTHLNSLPQTPALAAYHAQTRTLAQLSHAWDLPSLLIKPVQHLLRYTLLLRAIIEATPDSHGDKENLRRAKSMVEAVLHAINEGQRRREIVKEAFAAGMPAELLKNKGLGIVGRVRTGVATPRSISRTDSEENERVARMGRQLSLSDEFMQKFAKETVNWVKSLQTLMSVLRVWAEGFGRVIGLGPDVTSEAFDAFLVIVDKQLSALCVDLEVLVHDQLLPQLRILRYTIRRPALLLETLHALEPHRHALLQHNPAKGRPPPALNEASIAYVALRAQLCDELPAYLSLLHSGERLCVGQLAKWQARLWRDIRMRWSDLWDALRVKGERNAGSEETERVWRKRWEDAAANLQTLSIICLEEPTPRLKQARATASTSPSSPTAIWIGAGSLQTARSAQSDTPSVVDSAAFVRRKRSFTSSGTPQRLGRQPSTERLHSIRSAKSSSGHRHYVDAPETPPRRAIAWRSNMPMSLHQASSRGRLADSLRRDEQEKDRGREEVESARGGATNGEQIAGGSLLPSITWRNAGPSDAHHHPPSPVGRYRLPVPSIPRLTLGSRWYRAPALYTCRVVHECDPPEDVEYYGLPFFKLFLDDIYDILKEAGHPSQHRDLPLIVDAGEHCVLLARDMNGALGWSLATFMYPVD